MKKSRRANGALKFYAPHLRSLYGIVRLWRKK